MIEQALYFAIGFLVAALAAVVAVSFVSRRAMRLADARARLRAPSAEQEAIANRDALRARHAVDAVRLERRASRAEQAAIELRATVGEKSVKILSLEEELADRGRVSAEQGEEIHRLSAECRDLAGELGAARIALNDAFAQRDKAADAEATALARQSELEAEANRDRARIAILAARAESLETLREEMARSTKAAAEAEGGLTQALGAESARAGEFEKRVRASESLLEARAKVEVAQEKNGARIADLEARLAASERAREETLLENGRQLAAIADREAELSKARAEAAALRARLAALPAETAAAVETLQRENEALRGKVSELSAAAGAPADDASLRDAIERLGREVGRRFAAQQAARDRNLDKPGIPEPAASRDDEQTGGRRATGTG